MTLMAKIGLGALLLGAGVMVTASVRAANPAAIADFSAIRQLQMKAQSENDRIKLNCVNEKLILAEATLNLIDGGDRGRIAELHELRLAAENCVGKRQVSMESNTSFTAPTGAAQPGLSGPLDWGEVFEPPVNASPSVPVSRTRFGFHRAAAFHAFGSRRR